MYYIYILKSISHDTRYIGSTKNLEKRLREHNLGKVRYTKGRKPWVLIYTEKFDTRRGAMQREQFLKSGKGREWIDSFLQMDK